MSATLDLVCEALRAVGRDVVMPSYLKAVRERKTDGSFFTQTDHAAQRALTERLAKLIDSPVLGEEMSREQQGELWQQGNAGLWCIDPIDGTTNFLNGIPFFAISVAHLVDGRSQIGVVYNPVTDEAFYAERGAGAWLNGVRLPLRDINRVTKTRLNECVAGVDFKRIPKTLGDQLATQPPYYSQRNFGCSALEWCYTAAGRLDLYLHGGQMLWDYAAGSLILEEAGGVACTLTENNFEAGEVWKRSVIATINPALFAPWRDWLRAHLEHLGNHA